MAETIIRIPGKLVADEYGTKLANFSDLDNDVYGPYVSVAAAHAALSSKGLNTVGTTVGISGLYDTVMEYWYQGGTAQANLIKKVLGNNERDAVSFDGFIPLEPVTIIEGSTSEPDAILYSRNVNRFVAKKGNNYYDNWEERFLYNNGNEPYTSKLYPYNGKSYTWDGTTFEAEGAKAVIYDEQTLTTQQKEQVAQNIGLNAAIKGDVQQSLSDAQQVQAQNNLMGKAYSSVASDHSGLGKVYLDKNNGVLTQAMISQANTVFVIQYDFTLDENITVLANCVLEFDGGSISGDGNGKDTITGTNTVINATHVLIFGNGINVAGTWSITEVFPEWFYGTDREKIERAINFATIIKSDVILADRDYHVDGSIALSSNMQCLVIRASNKCVIYSSSEDLFIGDFGFTTFKNITFMSETQKHGRVFNGIGYNWKIVDCYFYYYDIAAKIGGVFIDITGCYFSDNNIGVATYKKTNLNTCITIDSCLFISNEYGFRDDAFNETVDDYGVNVGFVKKLNIKSCVFENNTDGFHIVNSLIISLMHNWIENNMKCELNPNYLTMVGNDVEPQTVSGRPNVVNYLGKGLKRIFNAEGYNNKATSFDFSVLYNGTELAKLALMEYTDSDKHDVMIHDNSNNKDVYITAAVSNNTDVQIANRTRCYMYKNGTVTGPNDITVSTYKTAEKVYSLQFSAIIHIPNIIITPNTGGDIVTPHYFIRNATGISYGIEYDSMNVLSLYFTDETGNKVDCDYFNVMIICSN